MAGSGKELVPVNKGGRPRRGSSVYNQDIADEIIDRLSHGQTLISICREDRQGNHRFSGEFPCHSTIYDWADPKHALHIPEFGLRFARAKLDQQRYWLEETIDIANQPELGEEETREISAKNGSTIRRTRKDMLHHRVLKIETRLKAIARMNPQLWAERLQQPERPEDDLNRDPPRLIIVGGLPDQDEPPPPRPDQIPPEKEG